MKKELFSQVMEIELEKGDLIANNPEPSYLEDGFLIKDGDSIYRAIIPMTTTENYLPVLRKRSEQNKILAELVIDDSKYKKVKWKQL